MLTNLDSENPQKQFRRVNHKYETVIDKIKSTRTNMEKDLEDIDANIKNRLKAIENEHYVSNISNKREQKGLRSEKDITKWTNKRMQIRKNMEQIINDYLEKLKKLQVKRTKLLADLEKEEPPSL